MRKRLTFFAALLVASIGLVAGFGGVARADTISPNPITFESSQGYTIAPINGAERLVRHGRLRRPGRR